VVHCRNGLVSREGHCAFALPWGFTGYIHCYICCCLHLLLLLLLWLSCFSILHLLLAALLLPILLERIMLVLIR
jgi:hypothetical protein